MAVSTQMTMKRKILKGGLQSITSQQFDDINNLFLDAQTQYQVIAKEEIDESFKGADPKEVTIIVDGVNGKPIEQAKLFNRKGILATRRGGVESVKAAYDAAIEFLQGVPHKSGRYKNLLTIKAHVSGRTIEGPIKESTWALWQDQSMIEIYSKARHASPVELFHSGSALGAAYTKVYRMPGVIAAFQYKSAHGAQSKYGQEEVVSKTGRGYTPKGAAFRPLAVPVLTLASIRNTLITTKRDGKPAPLDGRRKTGRNITGNRSPGGRPNLLQRGIYKGKLRPR